MYSFLWIFLSSDGEPRIFFSEIFTFLKREKETLLCISIISIRFSSSIIRFLLFRPKTERERRSVLFLLVLREDGGGGNFVLFVVFVCVLASRLLSNVVGVFCCFRRGDDSLLLLSRRRFDFIFCRRLNRKTLSSVLEYFRVHLAHSLFEGFAEGASLGFIVVSAHQVAVLAV